MKFTRVYAGDAGETDWLDSMIREPDYWTVWRSEGRHYRIFVTRKYIRIGSTGSQGNRDSFLGWCAVVRLKCPELAGFVLSGLLKALEPLQAGTEDLEELCYTELSNIVHEYLIELCSEIEPGLRYSVTARHVRDYVARSKSSVAAEGGKP